MAINYKKPIIITLIAFILIFIVFAIHLSIKQVKESRKQSATPKSIGDYGYGEPDPNIAKKIADRNIEARTIHVPETLNIAGNTELKKTLRDIFFGKQRFTEKMGTVYYSDKDFHFSIDPSLRISITSYKYKPDSSYKIEYEDLDKTVSLDELVSTFKSLKEGSQLANVLGPIGEGEEEVQLRKIGSKYFAVYDTYFKPGISWNRWYMTYDEKNKQLIYVVFTFAKYEGPYDKNLEMQADYNRDEGRWENVKYPEIIGKYLSELESVVANEGS